jgi:hypothetical protein
MVAFEQMAVMDFANDRQDFCHAVGLHLHTLSIHPRSARRRWPTFAELTVLDQ